MIVLLIEYIDFGDPGDRGVTGWGFSNCQVFRFLQNLVWNATSSLQGVPIRCLPTDTIFCMGIKEQRKGVQRIFNYLVALQRTENQQLSQCRVQVQCVR